jgi:hypothetical protein
MSKQTKRKEIAGAAVLPFRLVQLSSGKVIPTTAIDDDTYAANQELSAAADGDQVTCEYDGIVKLTAGAAIAKGARVMAQAAGAGKIATAAGASAKIVGEALEAASGDGHRIHVRLYANRRTVVGS